MSEDSQPSVPGKAHRAVALTAWGYLNGVGPVACGPFRNAQGRHRMLCIHSRRRCQPRASVQEAAGCRHTGGHVEGDQTLHEDPFRGILVLQGSAEVVQIGLGGQKGGGGDTTLNLEGL